MGKKVIELSRNDLRLMEHLSKFPAISSGDVVQMFGGDKKNSYLYSRVKELAGVKDDPNKKVHKRRETYKRGLYLICKQYKDIRYGAEHGEKTGNTTYLYSLTQKGMRALGRGDKRPPARCEQDSWIYYHQSRMLADLAERGVPLTCFMPAKPYKAQKGLEDRLPMALVMTSAAEEYGIAFFRSTEKLGKSVPRPVKSKWLAAGSYAQRHTNRPGTYVILVPQSLYRFALERLLRLNVYKTHLLTYEHAAEALSNLYSNPDYYLEYLASYLGVRDLNVSAYGGRFRHEGSFRGKRVYLCEIISGNVRILQALRRHAETADAPVYCLLRSGQLKHVPESPLYRYIELERCDEFYYGH